MIHFMTVHFGSNRWVDIQLRQIARNTPSDHRVWACLNDVPGTPDRRFHAVFDLGGRHGDKLNELARRASEVASPNDLFVFIDGDAFPIAPWDTAIRKLLRSHPLVAVRRDENVGDRQPHPCFAVTTPAFWASIEGDWSRGGRPWINAMGKERADVGSRVLEQLEKRGISWYPLLRSNRRNLHPVLFGVYADLVYHHGGGFRDATTGVDRAMAGGFGRLRTNRFVRKIHQTRLRRIGAKNARLSEYVYEQIRSDDDFITKSFLGADWEPARISELPRPVGFQDHSQR